MPDAKLTDLPNITVPSPDDKLYIVNDNLSKNITISDLAQNLPNITTTNNANISGNIELSPSSQIFINGSDYSNYVYNEIYTNFTPNTGNGLDIIQSTNAYSVLSGQGHSTFALSADTVDRIYVNVPNQPNYPSWTISFLQLGTAFIEVSAGPGVTVGSLNNSLSSAGQYSKIDLTYIGNQIYTLTGDLSAII